MHWLVRCRTKLWNVKFLVFWAPTLEELREKFAQTFKCHNSLLHPFVIICIRTYIPKNQFQLVISCANTSALHFPLISRFQICPPKALTIIGTWIFCFMKPPEFHVDYTFNRFCLKYLFVYRSEQRVCQKSINKLHISFFSPPGWFTI